MRHCSRALTIWPLLLALVGLACAALADNGAVQLSAYPGISVADGRSTITITAEVRDSSGRFVPDDTQVVFETSAGSFRENIIRTQSGFARAILVAPSSPGTARVRASVLRYATNTTLDVEFVADRSLLSTAKEYIEVVSGEALQYSTQEKVIEASCKDRGVKLRYRDIAIEADDLQLQVPSYDVCARNAKLTIGKKTQEFGRLRIKLNQRKGTGTSEIEVNAWCVVRRGWLATVVPEKRLRMALVNVSASGVTPSETPAAADAFNFTDISDSVSTIEAKKAIAYPNKEVQFQRANVRVSGTSVMKVPLFQVSTRTSTPVITEQFVNMSNNELAVNYPHYLSLKPGETSLLRFRYGNRFGSGAGATDGSYLDYELRWNRGDEMDGGITLSGIARDDWGLGIRQFWQTGPRTNITAQIDLPAHKSLFGNASISRSFDGFQMDLTAQHSRAVSGDWFQSQQLMAVVEKDPIKMGHLPAQLYLGVTASQNSYTAGEASNYQQRYGLRARMATRPLRFDRNNTLTAAYNLSRYTGYNVQEAFGNEATLSLTSQLSRGCYTTTTYDFVDDGFSSGLIGRHRVTSEFFASIGKLNARTMLSRSLDVDRLNATLDMGLRFSPLWRLSYTYGLDRYDGDSYMDQTVVLGYRIGFREIGLSYSNRTKRIGLDLLGTSFN